VHEDTTAFGIGHLVLVHGRERARDMVPANKRSLVGIAAEVLSDEAQRIGISYTGFCLTSLPHKRLPDDEPWVKKGHRVTLLVEPGRLPIRSGKAKLYGVPYGARARMILLYLQGQAVRTGNREVELGRSMRAWMERMGLSVGGETMRALREQAARISACSLKFCWDEEQGGEGWNRGAIVASGLRFNAAEPNGQDRLWEDRVVLDQDFYNALRQHPIPLREAAIRELRDRSMSLDLYVWMAYRLHNLAGPTRISWTAIYGQFGSGYAELRHFRPRFAEALAAAVAAYPEAKVGVGEDGITLHPSRPPVAALATLRA
jgi:Plasmid encoded RepA protein